VDGFRRGQPAGGESIRTTGPSTVREGNRTAAGPCPVSSTAASLRVHSRNSPQPEHRAAGGGLARSHEVLPLRAGGEDTLQFGDLPVRADSLQVRTDPASFEAAGAMSPPLWATEKSSVRLTSALCGARAR